MFYGRDVELRKLEKLYSTDEFQCAIVYGRRRVGKTTLIGEFCRNKKTVFFSALETNSGTNLNVLSNAIGTCENPDGAVFANYDSFENAFTKINEMSQRERIVFVIDEYSYLAGADKSISSMLQHFIDHRFSKSHLFMILCGSSMSFMENQVLGYQSPLYGRRTAQFRIEPLTYLQSAESNPDISFEQMALIYGITGGVPHYINKLNAGKNFSAAVIDNFLDRTSYLFEEPGNLLKQELREPAVYNAVITSVAGGATKLNEIAQKSNLESGPCSKYLSVLIDLGIIEKKQPVADTTKNKSLYCIKDNLFNFWFRFIPGNIPSISAGKLESVYERDVKPNINHYMGKIFEDICRQYLLYYAADLPLVIKQIGVWWGNNPLLQRQEEIDIMATGENAALFGECKWTNEKVGVVLLDDLRRKSEIFRQFASKYFFLFSRSGFTNELKKSVKNDNTVFLLELNDLYLKRNADVRKNTDFQI
jgi:AAA+ ATPase superfamily predicted ATPase